MENKIIVVGDKTYYKDIAGNLILSDYVREAAQRISTPNHILPFLSEERIDKQENFVVFTLDANNQLIKKHVVTRGLVNQSQIHPRETFAPAFEDRAVSIMIVHNHPSGNLDASESDLVATRRLVEVSKIMGIPILDHVIVTALSYKSLRGDYPSYFV